MFNVELPPDSSWKWSTGITTEDQNEIQRLEERIEMLELENKELFEIRELHHTRIKAFEARLEVEIDHSHFIESLLECVYGAGWDTLTIHEAKKYHERIKVLEAALKTSLELCREIQSSHKASIGSLYSHYTPQLRVSTVTGQAAIISAALEVK